MKQFTHVKCQGCSTATRMPLTLQGFTAVSLNPFSETFADLQQLNTHV